MSDWEEKGQEGGERRGVSWGLASASWCGGRWVPSCGVIRSGGVQPGGRRLVSGHQPGASGRCGGGVLPGASRCGVASPPWRCPAVYCEHDPVQEAVRWPPGT